MARYEAVWAIQKARSRRALFGDKRIHLLHVGKTGGTAVKHALESLEESPLATHKHSFTLAHTPPGVRVAAFVRDPVDRFVSAFNSRKRKGRPRHDSRWSEYETAAFGSFSSADGLALALSAGDPRERRAAEDAMRAIYHVRCSLWEWFGGPAKLRSRANDLWFVGRQESLDRDFGILCRSVGLEGLRLPSDEYASHRTPAGMATSLSEGARANLRRWYRRDYECIELLESVLGGLPGGSAPLEK